MPALASKGKGKARDARRSRSRNTTPSSVVSAGTAANGPSATSYIDLDLSKLVVPPNPQYGDNLDGRPADPKQLEMLVEELRQISEFAEARAKVCDAAMRDLAAKRKELVDEERERERVEREAVELRRLKAKKDIEDADDETGSRKGFKLKKRKDRSGVREERQTTHGVDGVEVKNEGQYQKFRFHICRTSCRESDMTGCFRCLALLPNCSIQSLSPTYSAIRLLTIPHLSRQRSCNTSGLTSLITSLCTFIQ